jgi:hypothetical protein
MKAKNSSTLHRCIELKKWPTDEVCHHVAPPSTSTNPEMITNTRAASVATPNT